MSEFIKFRGEVALADFRVQKLQEQIKNLTDIEVTISSVFWYFIKLKCKISAAEQKAISHFLNIKDPNDSERIITGILVLPRFGTNHS